MPKRDPRRKAAGPGSAGRTLPTDLYAWPRTPIPVSGGLRARSQRGDIGATWWSRRFLGALETVVEAPRLGRGRRYARLGQVVSMELAAGNVSALVQGSMPRPYETRIELPPLTAEEWRAVARAMASRAVFLARLLSGEMPQNIEEAFAAAGVRLFAVDDLRFFCSCPDSWVCKHVAAVCYLLAEAFDADPFLMLAWRGRDRQHLVTELRALRPPLPSAPGRSPKRPPAPQAEQEPAAAGAPRGFWEAGPEPAELRVPVRPTSPPDAILREIDQASRRDLGDLPEVLRALYLEFVPAARIRLDPEAASATPPSAGRRGPRRPAAG